MFFRRLLMSVSIGVCVVTCAWSQDVAQLGNTAFAEGRFAEAVVQYRLALNETPTFAVHVNLGHSYMKLERWTEAAASYQAAIDLDRAAVTSDVWLFLGQAQYQAERYRAALEAFLEAGSPKSDGQANIWAARCLIELEQWLGARTVLQVHLSRHPNSLEALELLAHVFGQMDNLPGVIDTYRALIRTVPDRTPYRVALANSLAINGQNQQAIDTLEVTWRLDAAATEKINRLLADLYLAEKMPQEAAVCYARVVRATEKPSANDYFRLGMAYFQSKEFISATEALQKMQQIDPDDVKADLYLGHIALEQDDQRKAERHYEGALRKKPTSTEALLALAQLQMRQKRYAQAATHFAQAIALGRKSPQAYYNHVLALLHTPGQSRQTEAALKAALAHHPADRPLQQLLDRYIAQLHLDQQPK